MNAPTNFASYQVGFDVPALPGMDEADIQTPCLILDLDALERNIRKMGDYAKAQGMRHRAHGKMHKSVDVLKLQMELGGAIGVCCQKVSEAEVFARAGIKDILVSNQVRDPVKIDRLARMPKLGARTIVCVDDLENVADLSAAAQKHGTELEVLVEIGLQKEKHPLRALLKVARALAANPLLVAPVLGCTWAAFGAELPAPAARGHHEHPVVPGAGQAGEGGAEVDAVGSHGLQSTPARRERRARAPEAGPPAPPGWSAPRGCPGRRAPRASTRCPRRARSGPRDPGRPWPRAPRTG